jgi:hydroxyacylglutathione hydrolase
LHARLLEVAALRDSNRPTLPISLASELATNPFLRVDTDPVADWCRREHGVGTDRVARFAAVRGAKDVFR